MATIRLPDRYNSASGRARSGPNVKESGVATVARVMTAAEKPQGTSTGRPIRFEIDKANKAKKIDHDAVPT
jgi:hypothetical protein